jgi:hypothetical protein
MNNEPLNYWRTEAITLTDAVTTLGQRAWHMLAYAPGRYHLDSVLDPAALAADRDIYEARLFDAKGELRWLRNPAGSGEGVAVYLSPFAGTLPGWAETTLPWQETVDGEYLLHGGGHLRYQEYIGAAPGKAGQDGNLAIVEQRLTVLERKTS